MNPLFRFTFALVAVAAFFVNIPARATQHIWEVTSTNHGQTYAYGSEQSRAWKMLSPNNHLALFTTYTNEPFANGSNIRYDTFTFNFPQVKMGSDGETFFYHASNGLNLPVAAKRPGFLGISQIKLLPTAFLRVRKVHGYLTMTLIVGDAPLETNPHTEIGFQH